VCVQPTVNSWSRRAEDLTVDKTDEKDAVLIARLTGQLRCYIPEPVDETWSRLRQLGARREQLITEIDGQIQQIPDLLECVWPAALDAAAQPFRSRCRRSRGGRRTRAAGSRFSHSGSATSWRQRDKSAWSCAATSQPSSTCCPETEPSHRPSSPPVTRRGRRVRANVARLATAGGEVGRLIMHCRAGKGAIPAVLSRVAGPSYRPKTEAVREPR
jgi:hypothetical protein